MPRDDFDHIDALRQRLDATLPPLEDHELGAAPPAVELLNAASVHPEPIRWLWPGWLARGKLHLVAGRPGTGKTTLVLALAATVTRGGRWPDGSRCAEAGRAIIWSGEDDPADTLTPRLMAAGADLERVHFVGDVRRGQEARPFDPATDVPLLAQALERVRPALLIVDPLVSAVAGDTHKSGEVRRALQPLVDLAARLDCALVGVSHLSKGTAGRDPGERVTGSIAFTALARIVLLAAKREDPPPGEPSRLLARAKSNVGDDSGGVGYDLEQVEAAPGLWASRVAWAGVIEGSARELLAQAEAAPADAEPGGAIGDAVAFLRGLLEDGPVPTKQVQDDADGAGYSWATIRRAAQVLKVEARKTSMRGGWVWTLPAEDAHENPKVLTQKRVSIFAKDEHLRGAEAAPAAADTMEGEQWL